MAKPNLADRSDNISRALRSEAMWASFSPAIKELYLEENLPGWLLEDIMRTLYDFRASPRVYQERFPKKDNENNGIQPIRGRTRQKFKDQMVPKLQVMCARPFRFKTPLRPQPAPLRYRPQEKIMYSIHHFLDSMFVFRGKHTWSTNHVGFLSPAGEAPQLSAWHLIESYCDSASTSIRCNQLSQARDTLYGIMHLFDLLARLLDPLFLGKIWRLALVLHGLDRRAPLLKATSTILGRLKATIYTAHGLDSPISIIVSCLLDVDEADFTPTMRLGFHETLVILDRKINDENITMLQMWSTYARYFSTYHSKIIKRKPSHPRPQNSPRSQVKARKRKQSQTPPQERLKDYIYKDLLLHKFDRVWHKCYNEQYLPVNQWRGSDVCVLISQHYAYAAFWLCDAPYIAIQRAKDVIEDTKPSLNNHPVWSVKAMAFSVASKIIATYHQHRGEVDQSEEVLDDAIKTLSHGDNLCLSKAMSICLTLVSWRREREDLPGSQEAEMRLLAIQDSIQGLRKCPDCRPSLKYQGCFEENRANCRNCNKPASKKKRKVCQNCKSAGSSRRRVIRLKTELWTSHGLAPTAVSGSQESHENLPLRKDNLTSDQFSITGLPISLTVNDILRAIRNTGRVFSS